MRKLILFILILNSVTLFGQNIFDHTGKIMMRYSSDTTYQEFQADTVYFHSPTNPFYKFYGGLITDSIKLDGGVWINNFNASQWTTSGSNIYYNTGNVGINNATPSYKLDVDGLIGGTNIETNTTSLSTKLGQNSLPLENETAQRRNTAIGYLTGSVITTGGNNTLLGAFAGQLITTTSNNTLLGYQCGSATVGSNNTFIGNNSGLANTTGSNNIFIGYHAGYRMTTYSNRLLINAFVQPNIAGDTTKSIIYGYMNSDPAYQRLTINGNVRVNGYIHRQRYGASAYIPDDSTCTTAASTTWKFVGAGANNKFVNINANGFTSDGDTLQFNQRAGDLRDSVSFTLGWSTTSKATNNGVIVTYGIFTKRVGEADYTERQWLSMTNKMQTSGDYYSWSCSPMLIFLTDDEKIQIRVKTASTSTTITTEDFATTIREN